MSHTSSKTLPLVLAIGVALAMAGCRDRDDPDASPTRVTGQADTTSPSTAETAASQHDANTPADTDPANAPGTMDRAVAGTDATPMSSDRDFVRTALAGGMAEVSVSRYVASKAKSGDVRSLAKRIADDHEALNAKLRTAAGADADAVQVDDTAKSAEAMIRGSTGADLDRAYLTHMADDHRKDIARFEAAAAQATDPAVRKLAEDALPTLREHAKLVDARLAAMK